jgi:hypothetical protein
MPLSSVQRRTNQSAAQVASLSATFSPAPTQNNLLVAIGNSDSTLTMTSTGWSLATSSINDTGLYQWYKIAGASESATVTITPATSASTEIVIEEWSGNVTASPLDRVANVATGVGTAAIASGTTAATTQADELAIAGLGWNVSGTVTTYTNSYVEVAELTGLGGVTTLLAVAELALSATGAASTAGTLSPNNNATKSGIIATYKAAAVITFSGSSVADEPGMAGQFSPHLNYKMWL